MKIVKMVKWLFIVYYSLFIIHSSFTQIKEGQIFEFADVFDSTYGINAYDALNIGLEGDSIRSDSKGYAVNGWIEDYYPDDKLLHKGYYIDGQLKAYKNYFPNGQLEREFRMVDINKSNMRIYYADGKLKSNVIYIGTAVLKEEEYYPSGQLEYIEENDKKVGCYIQRKFFAANGKPTSTLEFVNPKKKIYISKEYYDNGNVKEEGEMIYNISMGDYQKDGKWKFYDEQGNLKEEKNFSKGGESGDE